MQKRVVGNMKVNKKSAEKLVKEINEAMKDSEFRKALDRFIKETS